MTGKNAANRGRWWAAYSIAAAADTIAAGAGRARIRRFTKPALMPLLAVAGGAPRVAVPIAGSWVGDVALMTKSDAGLLGGVAGFAAAHVAYLRELHRIRPRAARRSRVESVTAVGFAATTAVAGAAIWPRLADRPALRLPVLGYACLVSAMGQAAVGTGTRIGGPDGRRLALGGALFVVSDALVATSMFGGDRRRMVDAAAMATYTAAQGLLTHALVARSRTMAEGQP
ncbi:lysoplasmalogenase [Pseudonocardia sp. GCM10023141]|uniref:lysoplasmalogenase n=1 Tax=Pseudonocardia sp. GCM10023141 TaxID=3252653 RepID=UPI003612D316